MSEKFLHSIADNDVITEENFSIFHAGGKSDDYIDIDNILSDVAGRSLLTEELISYISDHDYIGEEKFDVVAFLEKSYGPVGMLPYLTEIANELGKPGIIIRLDDRIRFEPMKVKGANIVAGNELESKSILLIDDVITTGNSQKQAADIAERFGAKVNGIVCLYARDSSVLADSALTDVVNPKLIGSVLTYMDCLNYGLVLSRNPSDYRIDLDEQLQELYSLSSSEARELQETINEEVKDVLGRTLESTIEKNNLLEDGRAREEVIDEALNEFDDWMLPILKTFLFNAKNYEKRNKLK